jgi:hypothetical protein
MGKMVKVNRRFAFEELDGGCRCPIASFRDFDPSSCLACILTSCAGRRESEQFDHSST